MPHTIPTNHTMTYKTQLEIQRFLGLCEAYVLQHDHKVHYRANGVREEEENTIVVGRVMLKPCEVDRATYR